MPSKHPDAAVALLRALRGVGLRPEDAPVALALIVELDRQAVEAAEERRARSRQGGYARWERADRAA